MKGVKVNGQKKKKKSIVAKIHASQIPRKCVGFAKDTWQNLKMNKNVKVPVEFFATK